MHSVALPDLAAPQGEVVAATNGLRGENLMPTSRAFHCAFCCPALLPMSRSFCVDLAQTVSGSARTSRASMDRPPQGVPSHVSSAIVVHMCRPRRQGHGEGEYMAVIMGASQPPY